MRELKFRAWSEETESFEYFDLYEGTECGLTNLQIWSINTQIEQYTGLKDKNGKEIYEGDIVRETLDSGLEEIDGEHEYIVQWDDDFKEFAIQTTPENNTFFHDELYQLNTSREVIGNIHENADLLEEEK